VDVLSMVVVMTEGVVDVSVVLDSVVVSVVEVSGSSVVVGVETDEVLVVEVRVRVVVAIHKEWEVYTSVCCSVHNTRCLKLEGSSSAISSCPSHRTRLFAAAAAAAAAARGPRTAHSIEGEENEEEETRKTHVHYSMCPHRHHHPRQ